MPLVMWIFMLMCSLVAPVLTLLFCPAADVMFWWSLGVMAVEIAVMLFAAFFLVERALKQNFDENGNRC